ncbi:MAG: ice-binding family protein [Nanoarchaeota archaeon]|nr:ice-binding family protein [Nanoarchaeota archaeon]
MEKNKSKFLIFALFSITIILSMFFVSAAQTAVNLGTAGDFVILSKSGISTTGSTSIIGNIGVSPIGSTAITGFGPIMDSSNQFATSSLVTGKIYAADYTAPTPTKMTTAISDMETAYTDAAGRTLPTATELGAGDISGLTITPGLYKWGTGVIINNGVTLSGGANDIFIFQIAQDLTVGNGAIITLSGGAQAKNIFWQVGGQTTLGTTSQFNGNILSQTAIVLNTGATLNGKALAQTAVTLDANTIVNNVVVTPTPNPTPTTSSGGSESTSSSGGSNSAGTNTGTNTGTTSSPKNTTTTPKETTTIGAGVVKIIKDGKTTEVSSVNGLTRLNSGSVKVETNLPVEVKGNTLSVTQSNGIKSEIKIMPVTASETAIARLKLKVCTEDNNCTITLKEVGTGTDAKVVYQVKAQKNVKIIGLFKAKMNIETNIDAETGKVISEHKPWWSLISADAS